MLKRVLPIALLFAIGAGVTAYATASARSERQDCPGRIVCPLTGELVCKDRGPRGGLGATEQSIELPACCRARD